MQDSELKRLLLETCPVRPGQEARAWTALRNELYGGGAARTGWSWLFVPTWRGFALTAVVSSLVTLALVRYFTALPSYEFATADSEAPGIYATAFYSKPAQAQVVWLNGMDPATDRPTYLEPTTVLVHKKPVSLPTHDPNSL